MPYVWCTGVATTSSNGNSGERSDKASMLLAAIATKRSTPKPKMLHSRRSTISARTKSRITRQIPDASQPRCANIDTTSLVEMASSEVCNSSITNHRTWVDATPRLGESFDFDPLRSSNLTSAFRFQDSRTGCPPTMVNSIFIHATSAVNR